jgi:hypothetical protein
MAATNSTYYPKVRCAYGQATTAEVNATKVIVKARPGKTIKVVDGWLRAIGGNAGGADTVVIEDTGGTDAFTMAVAGLTQNAVARVGLATHSTNTNVGTALTKHAGLRIAKAGAGALATCTAVDYCVFYIMAD